MLIHWKKTSSDALQKCLCLAHMLQQLFRMEAYIFLKEANHILKSIVAAGRVPSTVMYNIMDTTRKVTWRRYSRYIEKDYRMGVPQI